MKHEAVYLTRLLRNPVGTFVAWSRHKCLVVENRRLYQTVVGHRSNHPRAPGP